MTDHPKVRIDQATMTFAELADVEDVLGLSLSALMEGSQAKATAALVWVTVRRTDPTFTFEQAMQYGPDDIENVDADPEVTGASDGAKPPRLLVSGE